MSKRLTDDKLREFGNIQNVGDFAKNITLDLWTTILAGQALLGTKRDANSDNIITDDEIKLINNQQSVFYESLGLLLKDISLL